MKNVILVALILIVITGCSTMQPPRYSVSVDNMQILKIYEGTKVQVSSLNLQTKFDANCRLMGPIEPADGLSFTDFMKKAFNDELKMAEIYSSEGIQITGDITQLEFSSMVGLTNGTWDIAWDLISSNGNTLSISNQYQFKSGFDAITACNATADALTPAVQDLIKATVSHSEFNKLLGS